MLKVLDLFSGIGGFSLGLQATNEFETIAFCEIDPFCQKVLKKHWPNVPIFDDITKLGEGELNGLGKVDVICGGFPCQDISCAGKGAGIHAARSGLWWEMLRIIRLVRPRYVLVENVAALLNRGLDEVLGSLAESGYDAEWQIVRASDFGALHQRERFYAVAYANGIIGGKVAIQPRKDGERRTSDDIRPRCILGRRSFDRNMQWQTESDIRRVVDGIPNQLDRLRALGNAIVPQCAQYIAECVLEYDKSHDS